ncbi:MAG: hypothetical protein FJW95_02905 [Actinobacteria bacterium]|nr:hypothetical protein [Actinomycetota bacterium]
MLRRFETYAFAPHATAADRVELGRVLAATGSFIPEVLDSAVGTNRSATGVDLVWEHAYEAPDAYARYMCHPFHICVLDRYLLPENPECITASRRELQLGLFGYEVAGAPFRTAGTVRRIVAMRPTPDAAESEIAGFLGALNARAGEQEAVEVSVAAANTMGLEWFPDGWTHVWEQAFADEAAMRSTLDAETALLGAAPVGAHLDLWYEIERPAVGPGAAGTAPDPSAAWERVLMVDTVAVDPDAAVGYVAAFERLYLPGARARGLELVACWATPTDIGEPVTVTTVLDVGAWSDWERARNAAVADPAVGEWIAFRRSVMRTGRRTFVNSSSDHG